MKRLERLLIEIPIAGIVGGIGSFYYSEFLNRIPPLAHPNTIIGNVGSEAIRDFMQSDQNIYYGITGLLVGIVAPFVLEGAHYLVKRKKSLSS